MIVVVAQLSRASSLARAQYGAVTDDASLIGAKIDFDGLALSGSQIAEIPFELAARGLRRRIATEKGQTGGDRVRHHHLSRGERAGIANLDAISDSRSECRLAGAEPCAATNCRPSSKCLS